MSLDHPNLEKAIEKWWSINVKGTAMYRVAKKLRYVKDNIKKWNKEVLGDLFAANSKTQLELKEIQDKIQTSGYNEVSIKEENEKYHVLHMADMKHKVANRISKLRIGGIETRTNDEIGNEARNFFKSLLSADCGLDDHSQRALLDTIPSIINDVQNKALVAIPSEEEVMKSIFSFDGNKAPGPNGFPLFFFQAFWNILKSDVVKGVQYFFGAKIILKELNATFLVLIPKCPGVDSMDKFRSISLCNSFYKIISKVVTGRLLLILLSIISPQQSSFVLGRQILDSIITIHENIHSLVESKKQGFLMKLDLSKAYDHVDWSFLGKGLLLGISPSSSFKACSHQQFVDDAILMGTYSIKEASTMKNLLKTYNSASGQTINWEKSFIFFFNTPEDRQIRMARILGCQIGKPPSIYLGLPMGTKPMELFWNSLVDRFSRKLASWKGTLLSQAGKIQLLKYSLQSLPIYALSLFKIPGKFANAIEKIQKAFL
ncbi:uncharacterized protein LOC131061672 [Cryptomeria japonica]|uniref:uncharacterized protein LOC131061672 n=1 Tax=Cryptomeria japonica TaxID=3369 RepID=UPI0027DA33A0|nr:uncharacterized protein LOC131061672 [Cryptomeria japonica]